MLSNSWRMAVRVYRPAVAVGFVPRGFTRIAPTDRKRMGSVILVQFPHDRIQVFVTAPGQIDQNHRVFGMVGARLIASATA